MKNLGFNSPYALAGISFAVASIAISTFCDFTIRSAPTNPLGEYVVEDVRGARERPEWMPHDLYLEQQITVTSTDKRLALEKLVEARRLMETKVASGN